MTQRERIIEQAMRMFVSQGIRAVRMDDIAQQLGVSKRTLYELFGDKESLLYLAVDCYFEQMRQHRAAACVGARNVLEAMFMVLGCVMDHADHSRRLMESLRKFYPAVYEKALRESTSRGRDDLRRMLVTGIAEGLFIDTFNIDLAITVLYYTASALSERRELLLPEGMSVREAFVQIISNTFRGLSTPKGMQLIDECLRAYEFSSKK